MKAAVAAACIACAVHAPLGAATLPLWELGAGVAGLRLPHYRGSDQAASWALPLPYFVYRGNLLRADREGARLLLVERDRVDVDFSAAATAPAQSDDNRAREGMPDLPATVEFGPKVNVALARGDGWRVALRAPLRAVFGVTSKPRFIGWSAAPVLNLDLRAAGFDWGVQGGPLWGDRRLHDHVYGVAPAYAAPSRPAYRASGGFAGWQATAGVSRRTDGGWFGAFARLDSVAGAAFEASPLVRSRTQWSLGVAYAWILFRSERPAARED